MPPKQRVVAQSSPGRRPQQPQGFWGKTYQELTSSENASMVRSVAIFGAAVAFLHSSFGEYLLPEL